MIEKYQSFLVRDKLMAFASFIFGFSASDVIYFSTEAEEARRLPLLPGIRRRVGDAQWGNGFGYFLSFGEFISLSGGRVRRASFRYNLKCIRAESGSPRWQRARSVEHPSCRLLSVTGGGRSRLKRFLTREFLPSLRWAMQPPKKMGGLGRFLC